MRVPLWVRIVGGIELLAAAWAFFGLTLTVSHQGVRSIAVASALFVVAVVAAASGVGGYWLLRGNERGTVPSIVALSAQSLRVCAPGLVWLVGLGWTAILVLYQGSGQVPDGHDAAAWVGHHPYAGYFAINLPAFVFLSCLVAWRAIRRAEGSEGSHRAPAV